MHSFYLHWPFCPYRCHFCPFVAYLEKGSLLKPYHEALKKELELYAAQQTEKLELQTIYFGGGTPSTYPDELLLDMFGTLRKIADINKQTEITMEVNPGTVDRNKLAFWRDLGINRLSIGVQSLDERALKEVNRLQTTESVYAVLQQAEGLFDNVSVDLILGLPGVSSERWKEQVQEMVTWPISHMSIYFLTVHEFTPLYYRVQKKELELACDDELVDLYIETVALLREHNILQYEVSNFAKPGYECEHNRSYWARKPFKGFGVGAWSFDGVARSRNKKNLMLYMRGIEQGANSFSEFHEILTQEQTFLENIMLALRQQEGLSLNYYYAHLTSDKVESASERIKKMCEQGLLKIESDRLKLTVRGCAVEQGIIAQLS